MKYNDYAFWIGVARRHSRVEEEAEDLLQDALLIAAQQGRLDLSVEEHRRWLTGVIRNLAKMAARSSVRRKTREAATARDGGQTDPAGSGAYDATAGKVLSVLSPGARKVAVLALHGLDRAEIRSILNLTDAALRQRIRSIRQALGGLPADLRNEALGLAYASRLSREARAREFPLGLLRKALLRHLKSDWEKAGDALGTHDPSGHLIVIRSR